MEYREEVSLRTQLQRLFGFQTFKGNQEAIIRNLLQGKDTFVLMPTGGGKSLCFQLPALIQEGTAIVISPLIALMKNQVDAMRGYSEHDGVAHFLNSSLNRKQIVQVKDDVMAGRTKMLYVAPESLMKEENIEFFRSFQISFYAVDEAHCISEWGHDFRPEYRRIREMIDRIGHAPIIALTATATPKVQEDILKNLGMEGAAVFKLSFNRENLFYQIRPKGNATREIIHYIKSNPGKSGIIYCLSRKKVEQMAEVLNVNGIKALPYHAGLETAKRSRNQDDFLREKVDVIVATIAFGMGIDKPDVRYVIHYDMPKSLEGYYQETGRAGRDGGEGRCIAFYSKRDVQRLEKFIQAKSAPEQEVGLQLLLDTIDYAQGGDCRRRMLLHYFGEEFHEDNCGCCDNCVAEQPHFDGTEALRLLLGLIASLDGSFKSEHVVHVLMGDETPDTKMYRHEELPQYGSGKAKGEDFWWCVLRQAVLHDFVTKSIQRYGALKISKKGKEFLAHPYDVTLVEDHNYDEQAQKDALVLESAESDNVLLQMLKALRRDVAKKIGVAPYVVFQDVSLEEMAVQYPCTFEQLQYISGVTMGKAKRYGQPFIELIARYVEEQEIDPPLSQVVKVAPSRSQRKIDVLQCIDRKMDLDDIADSLQIDFDELLAEMESLVTSGVKFDIGYYVDMNVEKDIQESLYDYFKNVATSDSLDDAYRAFAGEDVTEEEVRLMRIRFLSEMAN